MRERNLNTDSELRKFRSWWLSRGYALSTEKSYERHLMEFFAGRDGLSTSLRDAQDYVWDLAEYSPTAAQMAYRALQAFARFQAERYDEPNPLVGKLRCPRVGEPVPANRPIATRTDVQRLLATCSRTPLGRRDYAIITVLAATGMRRAEVARMRLADIDLETGVVVVPLTKSKRARATRLDEAAIVAIERYLRVRPDVPDGHLWHGKRFSTLQASGISQMIAKRAKTAAVKVTPHSFRRGFATEWLRRGGSETYLRRIAGWRDARMVERYVDIVASEEALTQHRRLFGDDPTP